MPLARGVPAAPQRSVVPSDCGCQRFLYLARADVDDFFFVIRQSYDKFAPLADHRLARDCGLDARAGQGPPLGAARGARENAGCDGAAGGCLPTGITLREHLAVGRKQEAQRKQATSRRTPPFIDPPGYARYRPEATLLYRLVEEHYAAFSCRGRSFCPSCGAGGWWKARRSVGRNLAGKAAAPMGYRRRGRRTKQASGYESPSQERIAPRRKKRTEPWAFRLRQ